MIVEFLKNSLSVDGAQMLGWERCDNDEVDTLSYILERAPQARMQILAFLIACAREISEYDLEEKGLTTWVSFLLISGPTKEFQNLVSMFRAPFYKPSYENHFLSAACGSKVRVASGVSSTRLNVAIEFARRECLKAVLKELGKPDTANMYIGQFEKFSHSNFHSINQLCPSSETVLVWNSESSKSKVIGTFDVEGAEERWRPGTDGIEVAYLKLFSNSPSSLCHQAMGNLEKRHLLVLNDEFSLQKACSVHGIEQYLGYKSFQYLYSAFEQLIPEVKHDVTAYESVLLVGDSSIGKTSFIRAYMDYLCQRNFFHIQLRPYDFDRVEWATLDGIGAGKIAITIDDTDRKQQGAHDLEKLAGPFLQKMPFQVFHHAVLIQTMNRVAKLDRAALLNESRYTTIFWLKFPRFESLDDPCSCKANMEAITLEVQNTLKELKGKNKKHYHSERRILKITEDTIEVASLEELLEWEKEQEQYC